MTRVRRRAAAGAALALCATACATAAQPAATLRVGAVFPLAEGNQPDAGDELDGVTIARDLVNRDGGVAGRQLVLDIRDVDAVTEAPAAALSLHDAGVPVVLGAYSSTLSIAASDAVARQGMVYWESGATADQLTGRGLPLVFRVGADGSDLGGNSVRFLSTQLAPRLHRGLPGLRVALVTAHDAYGESVAQGAVDALRAGGVRSIQQATYDPFAPYWPPVLQRLRADRPDVVLLSSHVPDGISFRRAFVAAGLHARAFIGTTMAQCPPSFGSELGAGAVGVFASDRPDGPVTRGALSDSARAVYDRFAAEWRSRHGGSPTSEGIAGFSAAWALFHDTLPRAAAFSPGGIAAAARSLDLPVGSLPDGAGIRFAGPGPQLGQNLRPAAEVEEWQTPSRLVAVWPPPYASGPITLSPDTA